jgi:hypothetical protein
VNCIINNKNINNYEGCTRNVYPRRPNEMQRRNYNVFEYLSTEVECYKCNIFGHMATKDCRMKSPPRESEQNNSSNTEGITKNMDKEAESVQQ